MDFLRKLIEQNTEIYGKNCFLNGIFVVLHAGVALSDVSIVGSNPTCGHFLTCFLEGVKICDAGLVVRFRGWR